MSDQADQLRRMVQRRPSTEGGVQVLDAPSSGATARSGGVVSVRPHREAEHHLLKRSIAAAARRPAPTIPAPIEPPPPVRLARAIAITSGKGGVGKTNLAVNLAVALSGLGRKTCLFDADLGLANADVLCNLTPRVTLNHVVNGKCHLVDAAMIGPGGFRLIPGASGIARLADLNEASRQTILKQLMVIERVADVILLDCGAGLGGNVLGFASAAHQVVVVTTPEPTSMTDAYGMIKSLFRANPDAQIELVANMVHDVQQGWLVYDRLQRVVGTFLNKAVRYAGCIPADPAVPAAVCQRLPYALISPRSVAARATQALAMHLAGTEPPETDSKGAKGFFARLVKRIGRAG